MSFWETLTLVGTAATILGVFLTLYTRINNKTLKEESRLTRESIIEVIKEESRLTREKVGLLENSLLKFLTGWTKGLKKGIESCWLNPNRLASLLFIVIRYSL